MRSLDAIKEKGGGVSLLFYLFLLGYFTGLTILAGWLNITIDELFTLNTSSKGIHHAIRQSYDSEGQPPVYFALLSIWRLFNSSMIWARLFSVTFVGLAAVMFKKLINLYTVKENSRWLVVVFLLNPFTIWAGTELRLYAFLLFLSLASLYFFYRFFHENKNRDLVYFVISGIVGVYTQYLYVFLFFSLGVSILVFKGWKVFFKFCLYSLPAAGLLFIGIMMTTNPMELAQVNSLSTTKAERVNSVFHSPQDLVLAMNELPFARVLRWLVLAGFNGLLLFGYYRWYKTRKEQGKDGFELLNLILVTSLAFLIMFSVFFAVTGIDYHDRYLTIAFPTFMMTLFAMRIYSLLSQRLIFAAIGLLYVSAIWFIYRHPVKEYDDRALASYVTSIEKEKEPLLFYQKVLSLPFKLYYHGNNPVVPLPDSVEFNTTYFSKLKDTVELKSSLGKIGVHNGSLLLMTDRNEPVFQHDTDLIMLNDYVKIHYDVTLDTVFRGQSRSYSIRVRRLEERTK